MKQVGNQLIPSPPLFPGIAPSHCRACAVIPARDEEIALPRCLDALHRQVDLRGEPLNPDTFEIILLLNNCTDASLAVAQAWQSAHPATVLHIVERTLPPLQAHVGTARRLLMETAWYRLQDVAQVPAAMLCTDADTVVAPDWLAQNLRALEEGADVVGGQIHLLQRDLNALPAPVQHCYRQDRRYAALVAQLEDGLDPQPGDRWPRHLDHFGSSLTCTPEAYAAVGGMPALSALEDEAFVDRVRHAGLYLRHAPAVRVYTSARLAGRAPRGMARQLRLWSELPCHDDHTVPSAAFLAHRFQRMHQLRQIFTTGHVDDLDLPTDWWRETFRRALNKQTTCPGFLGAIYCDILIAEGFRGKPTESIADAVRNLEDLIATLQPVTAKVGATLDLPPRRRALKDAAHEATISSELAATGSGSLQ